MIPSLEGSPTKAKEAPSPHEVRLAPLDTNPVFQCLRETFTSFCELFTSFCKVIECLLMFLLNVLLDLTNKLDVFSRSFATQNTSTFLYSILTYQIKFLPPLHPTLASNFLTPPTPFIITHLPPVLDTQEQTNLNV